MEPRHVRFHKIAKRAPLLLLPPPPPPLLLLLLLLLPPPPLPLPLSLPLVATTVDYYYRGVSTVRKK